MSKPKGMNRGKYNKLTALAHMKCEAMADGVNCVDRWYCEYPNVDRMAMVKLCKHCDARVRLGIGRPKSGVPTGSLRNTALPGRRYRLNPQYASAITT